MRSIFYTDQGIHSSGRVFRRCIAVSCKLGILDLYAAVSLNYDQGNRANSSVSLVKRTVINDRAVIHRNHAVFIGIKNRTEHGVVCVLIVAEGYTFKDGGTLINVHAGAIASIKGIISVVRNATAVHNKSCTVVERNSAAVVSIYGISFNVDVVQGNGCLVINMDTARTVITVTSGDGTAIYNEIGFLCYEDDLAVQLVSVTKTTVNGVLVEIDRNISLTRDVNGAILEAVRATLNEFPLLVGVPIGKEIDYDTLVFIVVHIGVVLSEVNSCFPA